MTDSIIERAARALLRSQDGLPKERPANCSEEAWQEEQELQRRIEDDDWPNYVEDVRAVLTAIYNPTPQMMNAGLAWQSHCSDIDSLRNEMLHAALHPDSYPATVPFEYRERHPGWADDDPSEYAIKHNLVPTSEILEYTGTTIKQEKIVCEVGPPSFELYGSWPNELAEKPEDLVGRNVKSGERYFRIVDVERISESAHRYTVEPHTKAL